MNQYLAVGKIIGIRGLKGELKVKSFCDSSEGFCKIKNLYLSPGSLPLVLEYVRINKDIILIKLSSINSMEESINLIGKNLYAYRDDISKENGKYFIKDIIGLEVFDIETNKLYGNIYDVLQTGANDIYCIKDNLHKKYFLPAIKDIVKNIDLINKKVWIRPLKGIFND